MEPVAPELLAKRQQMLEHLEAAAVAGNPIALSRLSMIYSFGRDESASDAVKAHAYIAASRDILGTPLRRQPDENLVGAPQLTPGQLIEAERLKSRSACAPNRQVRRTKPYTIAGDETSCKLTN